MTRLRAVLLCAVLVALGLAFPAQAVPRTCGTGGDHDNAGPNWLALRPLFPKGPEAVTAIATPVFRPDTIFATNGVVIAKTVDAGCNWKIVYDSSELLLGAIPSPFPSRIVTLAAPSSATSSSHVYAGVERLSPIDGTPRPVVVVSTDEGETWTEPPPGPGLLPPAGRLREIAVCNLVPTAAYAVVDVGGAAASATALYTTVDAGRTWVRRTSETGRFALGGLVVNPLVATNVFAVGATGLQRSDNSGAAFEDSGPGGDAVTSLSAAVGSSYVRLAVGHPGGNVAHVSDDGGFRWRPVPTPVSPRFVAVAPLRDALAISDTRNVVVTMPGSLDVFVTPRVDLFDSLRFAAPTQAGVALMGIGDGKVLRAVLDLATFRPIEQRSPIRLLPQVEPNYFPPAMLPVRPEVSLPAGGTRDVPFTLFLPRTPSPIDVMFLIDSTGSMQPVIDGLKQSMAEIVNDLSSAGLDVEFGVGDFRDVPAPHGKSGPNDMPYRRFRVIGPADQELQDAISQIRAAGGNGITSALIAAEQATAGKGYRAADGEQIVDPGQDAKFRPGTLRLAVIITDIGMAQGGNYPRLRDTARLLREHNVRAVGVAVRKEAFEDEDELARRTGALTPVGGLDCDANGTNDLDAGDPLVCRVPPPTVSTGFVGTGPPVHLAPAIVALTERVADFRPVGVTLTGDPERATVTKGAVHPAVNLKADNEVPFTVRFSCPVAPKASRHEFTITAGPAATPGGRSTATLECAAAPGPPKKKPAPPRPPVEVVAPPVVAPVAAAAAPGPPPPNPVPNPNPNLNPNPQPGLNANVGIADQRQEEFQLALVEATEKQFLEQAQAEQGITYAMSRRREADPAMLLGPAALLVASATWVARRRTAVRPATQRVRTRRF